MIRKISCALFLVAVAALTACTIDAKTTMEPPTTEDAAYDVTYTAPEAAPSVSMCDTIEGEWRCGAEVVGRTVTWSGELDAVRLCQPANEGGYIVNFSFPVPPYFALTQDGLGGFVEVGELHLAGPLPIVADPVDNARAGGNYWLHLPAGEC